MTGEISMAGGVYLYVWIVSLLPPEKIKAIPALRRMAAHLSDLGRGCCLTHPAPWVSSCRRSRRSPSVARSSMAADSSAAAHALWLTYRCTEWRLGAGGTG